MSTLVMPWMVLMHAWHRVHVIKFIVFWFKYSSADHASSLDHAGASDRLTWIDVFLQSTVVTTVGCLLLAFLYGSSPGTALPHRVSVLGRWFCPCL